MYIGQVVVMKPIQTLAHLATFFLATPVNGIRLNPGACNSAEANRESAT